ncbi:MAG: SprB repeat-containing protein, partial [Bacteroidota bacterium]
MKHIALCVVFYLSGLLAAQAQCPTVSGTVSNVSCNGGSDGSITLLVSGDTAG